MNTEVAKRPADVAARRPASFAPQTLAEAMEFAKLIANSSFVPQEYRGKPGDILACIQMGAELGLAPLQAMQGIACINGKPNVYGDAALALVQASGLLVDHDEDVEGEGDERFGWCVMERKGRPTKYHKKFSIADAKRAGLIGKNVWKGYPDVMLVARARSNCMKAGFPDILKGVITREEAVDYPTEEEQLVDNRPTSDLPTALRESDVLAGKVDRETGEVLEGTKDDDLEVALQASVEVAGGAAPASTSVLADGANLPRSSGVVPEDGAAPSLLLDELEGDLDEPVLINERDRRYFHVCREQGHHPKDSAKAWLSAMYGYSSTSEIHKDQLEDICARLRDPMPL